MGRVKSDLKQIAILAWNPVRETEAGGAATGLEECRKEIDRRIKRRPGNAFDGAGFLNASPRHRHLMVGGQRTRDERIQFAVVELCPPIDPGGMAGINDRLAS